MPASHSPTSPAPPCRRRRALLWGLLGLLAASAAVAAPLPATQVESLLADARKGETAALEQALPRIGDRTLAALARARIAASQLRDGDALRALDAVLGDDAAAPGHRAIAWSIAADAYFAAGDYARAADASGAWHALLAAHGDPDGEAASVAQFHEVALLLSPVPPQAVRAFEPETVAVRRDRAGLPRATITVNGIDQDAVLDTGANLSVASASAARRLGLRMLDGEASVGSGSRNLVATRLGVAERLDFAGIALSNVAFLVLDDAQLDMPLPGGYRIDAILGFPVMRALRRIRFDADGRLTPEPTDAGADVPAGNLRVVGSDLFVDATVQGIRVPLHLDTGAPRSSLSARFAQRHPGVLEGLERREERVAGAGGATTRRTALWPQAGVAIDGRPVVLPELPVVVTDSDDVVSRNQGLLGGDVLGAFDAWALDFVRMRVELGDRLPVPGDGPGSN